ncbi:hypothetical protein NDR89_19730 [Cupriavidus gilardii]|uniref:DUF2188 domain-containing protein n=1 Tax=Cupriavidus gilardii TaxID=82541 RepID=A0ABY4VSA1_9BURK|nr:hypothetical protein [Cupriavidus gilardii]USE78869.1 hypothetical protein NDR89_19730 [Cupriavidus gilardii]
MIFGNSQKTDTAETDRGHYYVVYDGKWNDKKFYASRQEAIEFANGMARRGYDSVVVKLVSTHEHEYQVNVKTHD